MVEDIRKKLEQEGLEPTDVEVRKFARMYSLNGINLELEGKCSVHGCWYAVAVTCDIPSQNGYCPGKFCSYHYGQVHLSEDERDEVDAIVGRPLFEK